MLTERNSRKVLSEIITNFHLCSQHFLIIYMSKLFQKDAKLQTNKYVNSRLLLADPNKFIYLFYIIQLLSGFYLTKKYVSIEKRICFKKDLLATRDQLPHNIPVTYFPYSFLCRIS